MKYDLSISVVIPVYNEKDLIVRTFQSVYKLLNKNFQKWEIIIVESGSTDGTEMLVDQLSKKSKNVKVYHQFNREGMGSALKLGYSKCRMDLVWKVVPDLPFRLKCIHEAMPLFTDKDYVLSYRVCDNRPLKRKLMTIIYNLISRRIFRLKVRNANSPFNVFKRSVLNQLDLKSDGWFIYTEVLSELNKRNFQFAEIPAKVIPREAGKSTVRISTSLSVLKEMIIYYRKYFLTSGQ